MPPYVINNKFVFLARALVFSPAVSVIFFFLVFFLYLCSFYLAKRGKSNTTLHKYILTFNTGTAVQRLTTTQP